MCESLAQSWCLKNSRLASHGVRPREWAWGGLGVWPASTGGWDEVTSWAGGARSPSSLMWRGEPLSRNMGSTLPLGTSSVSRTEQPRLHSSHTSHEAVTGGARGQCIVHPGGCPRDSAEPGAGPLRHLPGTRGGSLCFDQIHFCSLV